MRMPSRLFFILFLIISIVVGCGTEPSVPNHSVMVFGRNQQFYALDKETGKVEWKVNAKGNTQEYPIVQNGIVYGYGGDLYAMDVTNGDILWSVDGKNGLTPTIVSDPYLIGADFDRIDIFNTSKKKKHSVSISGMMGSGNPIIQDGTLYYGTNNSIFYAVDIGTRKEKWSFVTKGRVVSPPIIAGDLVVFNDYDQQHTRFFYGLDRTTGVKKWEFDIQDDSTALTVSDGIPYFATNDGGIHAIDIQSGKMLWTIPTDIQSSFFPVTAKGIICFSGNGFIYGFDPKAKEIKWKLNVEPISQPTMIEDVLYVNSIDGLHSIHVTLGTENWVFDGA